MSTFEVKTKKLKYHAEDEKKIQKKLLSFQQEITSCQQKLGKVLEVSSEKQVQQKLKSINDSIGKEAKLIGQMSEVLTAIANIYMSTEKGIEGTKIDIKDPLPTTDVGGNLFFETWKDILNGTIGEFGPIGSAENMFENIKDGNFKPEDLISLILKVTSAGAACVENPHWVKNILGISDETYESISDFLNKEMSGYFFDRAKDGSQAVADKVKVFTKWGSVVLTGFLSFLSNQDEFKDKGGMKNERFWKETILETGIDLLKGVGLSAGLAALGVSSWPALVIVGLVSVGGDSISNLFFHKDLTEVISDGLIDFDEENGIMDKVKDILKDATGIGALSNAAMNSASKINAGWASMAW